MITMNAFNREPESLLQSQLAAVERVMRSGWWILGEEVAAFESEWSSWSGCKHTVGVGNGLDALEIGLKSLNIGEGDEVITTSMTAFATVLAIIKTGATPVFGDINPETAILSPESVLRCIGPRTKAIIVVHLYGQSAPLTTFQNICQTQKIHLIEDCAQAHGARWENGKIGTAGVFAGWSFYPTKNLGAIGDAGALSTQNHEVAEKARQIRNYGQSVRYCHPIEGLNSRLDEIQAAILRERLKLLDQWIKRRQEIASNYANKIDNPNVFVLPLPKNPNHHSHHLFVIRSPKRDKLQEHLKKNDIESLIHYPIPAHRQDPAKHAKTDPLGLKFTDEHARECLSIPCNPYLKDDEVQKVVDAINSFI